MVSSIVLLYNVCLATPCRTTDSLLLEPTVFKPIRPNIKPKYDHIFERVLVRRRKGSEIYGNRKYFVCGREKSRGNFRRREIILWRQFQEGEYRTICLLPTAINRKSNSRLYFLYLRLWLPNLQIFQSL